MFTEENATLSLDSGKVTSELQIHTPKTGKTVYYCHMTRPKSEEREIPIDVDHYTEKEDNDEETGGEDGDGAGGKTDEITEEATDKKTGENADAKAAENASRKSALKILFFAISLLILPIAFYVICVNQAKVMFHAVRVHMHHNILILWNFSFTMNP